MVKMLENTFFWNSTLLMLLSLTWIYHARPNLILRLQMYDNFTKITNREKYMLNRLFDNIHHYFEDISVYFIGYFMVAK